MQRPHLQQTEAWCRYDPDNTSLCAKIAAYLDKVHVILYIMQLNSKQSETCLLQIYSMLQYAFIFIARMSS